MMIIIVMIFGIIILAYVVNVCEDYALKEKERERTHHDQA